METFRKKDIEAMIRVCDYDYQDGARFLGNRNKAILLVPLDSGMRASELLGMTFRDVDAERGWIKVIGKGAKERVVRIGAAAQKALWKYLMHQPDNGLPLIWLTEEARPQARLLDIGAGRGWPGLYLAKKTGCNAVLTDLPLAAIRNSLARAKQHRLQPRSSFLLTSGSLLPFRPRVFDAVTHTDAL